MRPPFPFGDTNWRHERPISARRDFHCVLNQGLGAIEPHLPPPGLTAERDEVSEKLAESPGRRLGRMEAYFDCTRTI